MNYDWRYLGGNRASEYWNKFDYSFDADELAFSCVTPRIRQSSREARRFTRCATGTRATAATRRTCRRPSCRTSASSCFHRTTGRCSASHNRCCSGSGAPNKSGAPLTIPTSLLDPKAGFVELLIHRVTRGRPASGAPEAFLPIIARCFDLAQEFTQTIQPGGMFEDNVNLTFGAAGFSFAEPGLYEVQALLVVYDRVHGVDRIAPSNVLTLDVQYPGVATTMPSTTSC